MKNLLWMILLFVPFVLSAQSESEKFSLTYDGQMSFRDQYLNPEGDTLVKVGAFAANRIRGEYFFGQSNSQLGLFASYQCGNVLVGTYRARDLSGFDIGLSFRQNFGFGEVKVGAGYYRLAQRDYGYIDMTTDTFSVNSVKPGLILSASLLLTPEIRIFPRFEISIAKRVGFTNEYSDSYFENGELDIKADLSLVRIVLPVSEFYISPIIGFEKSAMTLNSVYRAGIEISGNYNVRTNVIKVGYFRERNLKGIEGVFISVNPTALYLAFR